MREGIVGGLQREGIPVRAAALLAAAVLIWAACAKQGYPPGGPVDDIPPVVVETVPDSMAVNVPPDTGIRFVFSEPMDEESVIDNILILPLPDVWPTFEFSRGGRELDVTISGNLADNTTYVVTIGANAADRERNRLTSSVLLVFSTGPTIEDRAIRGRVIPEGFGPGDQLDRTTVDVAAYRLDGGEPDPSNDIPAFYTQTGEDGGFELRGLSGGIYRLCAVGDRDENGFYTKGYDYIGVSSRDVVLAGGDSAAVAPTLVLARVDTSMVQLLSIRTTGRGRVEFFFDRPIRPEPLSATIPGLTVVKTYRDPENAAVMVAVTEPQEAGRTYTVQAVDIADRSGNLPMPFTDFVPRFIGTDHADTTALVLVAKPAVLTADAGAFRLVFNRMLAPGTADAVRVEPVENASVSSPEPNVLAIAPPEGWPEGTTLHILLDPARVLGIGGNTLRESDRDITVRIAPADSLTLFIAGEVVDETGNAPANPAYRVQLHHMETGGVLARMAGEGGTWNTGPVLPGRYLVRVFRDDDGNGELTLGTPSPFRPSEPVTELPDTLVAISRWGNEGNTIVLH